MAKSNTITINEHFSIFVERLVVPPTEHSSKHTLRGAKNKSFARRAVVVAPFGTG
jgi:hypothetical protein